MNARTVLDLAIGFGSLPGGVAPDPGRAAGERVFYQGGCPMALRMNQPCTSR